MALNEEADLEELVRGAGGEADEDQGGGLDLTTLVMVARKSLPWVLLLVILGLLSSWLFLRYTSPVYQSTSLLKIDEKTEAGVLGLEGLGKAPSTSQLSGEIELIKSNLIYRRLRDSLDLEVNYYAEGTVLETELYRAAPFKVEYEVRAGGAGQFNSKFGLHFLSPQQIELTYQEGGQEKSQKAAVGDPIETAGFTFKILQTPLFRPVDTDRSFYFIIRDEGFINGYLSSNLQAQIVNPDANTISIAFTDHNPLKAHDIVNKVDTAYLVEKIQRKQEQSAKTLRYLAEQSEDNRQLLRQAEEQLQDYMKQNKLFDAESELGSLTTLLNSQEEERQKLQEQLSLLRSLNSQIEQNRIIAVEGRSAEQSIPALAEVKAPELTERISELYGLQLEINRISNSYTPATQAIKNLQDQIAFVKRNINQLLRQNQQLLQRQLDQMNGKANELQSRLAELPEIRTQIERLKRPRELYEKYSMLMMDKTLEYNIARAGITADFQVLSPANLPGAPIAPVRTMVYAIGLAVGLVLGIGLIAVRYLLHNTVTNVGELERNTSSPVLGVIPTYDKEKMSVSKLIVDKNPKSAISEAIRSIRTNLEFMASSKKKRLISITSTVSGEGKTFVTVNLAGIIAASDQRVVILDLDMRKPKVNLAFEAENTKGVSTILIDKHSWQECIQHTTIPTLDFISAGPTPPNPSELILSSRFDDLIEHLYQFYDVIIIDTPPVGLVTDGILIMRKADVPIYIVRANYSKKAFLKNINKLVRTNGFTKITTILNDAKTSGMYGYGYGYGQGYGQGYYEEAQPQAAGVVEKIRKRFS
ncbi:GumC family protein [Hymenobacter wooponensis]|uniref:non-specific protein-tyrosine kinase n=1 Tax=Hymenobacter wooponensis TaxID=1525360 RepID=A0A4Z0MQE1_9BACT|nr:polysaccharide biosynthesis tyrosine autokinase [Hymenobacter wooponensis]TGD81447.1 polysaccharide biosynthesis tyrosine autokinase [Hymenobacter wooponensis]